jgi:hypothetical protein
MSRAEQHPEGTADLEMAAKPPLVSRWGGTPPAHDALVLRPKNQASDLILRSEVIEQSFFSLQKHEYHYKAENQFDVKGTYCTMKVKWNGPKIEFERLGHGPGAVMSQSWFSAKVSAIPLEAGGGVKHLTPPAPSKWPDFRSCSVPALL